MQVTCKPGSPKEPFRIAEIVANGLDCDAVGVAAEAYCIGQDPQTQQPYRENPLTGRPWGPGEMDDVAQRHDGLAKGWVTECVSVMCINRAGDIGLANFPYKYVGGRYVHWLGENTFGGGAWTQLDDQGAVGVIPTLLRKIMNTPSTGQLGLSPELTREERDRTVGDFLARQGHVPVLFVPDSDRPLT